VFDFAYKKAIPNLLECQDKFYVNLNFFKNVYEDSIKKLRYYWVSGVVGNRWQRLFKKI